MSPWRWMLTPACDCLPKSSLWVFALVPLWHPVSRNSSYSQGLSTLQKCMGRFVFSRLLTDGNTEWLNPNGQKQNKAKTKKQPNRKQTEEKIPNLNKSCKELSRREMKLTCWFRPSTRRWFLLMETVYYTLSLEPNHSFFLGSKPLGHSQWRWWWGQKIASFDVTLLSQRAQCSLALRMQPVREKLDSMEI